MHYDALIIGAGLSGLSAGIRLAIGGLKVRIFETHSIPGGLNSYYVRGKSYQDVGLHALTNYAPESQRGATLNKILRQLRIKREELQLCQQLQSEITFPNATLKLNNDFQCFREQIRSYFPSQLEGFDRLVKALPEFASVTDREDSISTRAILEQEISEPLLREMLLCPVMFYGNPLPQDMGYGQFAIMFRSIVMEGMSRPLGGMKSVVQLLVSRFTSMGGQLSLCNGIKQINCKDGCVQHITDSNGEEHTANFYISNIGSLETAMLCQGEHILPRTVRPGGMAFLEAIFDLDCNASSLGIDQTVIFRSSQDTMFFDIPNDDMDCRSHIICYPGNFENCSSIEEASSMRITVPASAGRWFRKDAQDYANAKQAASSKLENLALEIFPALKGHITGSELFTPYTLKRFTGHINGAVYGSPDKLRSGNTLMKNLHICGTDQGLLGIVGSLTSGIITANSCMAK